MTDKEKAKAYDEALIKIRPLYEMAKKEDCPIWSTYECIFPELAESEDERIRKEIIDFICSKIDRGSVTKEQREKSNSWIAYLEKQKESLHISETCKENANSFTDEDERIRSCICFALTDVDEQRFTDFGVTLKDCLAYLEKQKEQKSIISAEESLGISQEEYNKIVDECIFGEQKEKKLVDDKSFEDWIDGWYNEHHRDGYITMDEREFKNWSRGIWNIYQKPAEWSEEDESIRKWLIDLMQIHYDFKSPDLHPMVEKALSYLEKLNDLSPEQEAYLTSERFKQAEKEKDEFTTRQFLRCLASFDKFREGGHYWLEYVGGDTYVGRSDNVLGEKFYITPRQLFTLFSQQLDEAQEPPKEGQVSSECETPMFEETPSEKQIIDALIHHLSEQDGFLTAINCISTKAILSWLEKQKEQKPAEWSEEDENKLFLVIETLIADKAIVLQENPPCKALHRAYDELINWLKSLHPHWKPSEEQMEALQSAIVFMEIRKASDYDMGPLKELYKQLKKL